MIIKRQVKQIKPSYNRLTEDHLRGHTKVSSMSGTFRVLCSVRDGSSAQEQDDFKQVKCTE